VKFKSQVYASVSGSVGGLTYSHNQGGMYCRARAVPTNPNTSFQQTLRNAMGQLTTRWGQTLTQTQRDAWAVFATNVPVVDSLGESRTIPPLSWYLKAPTPGQTKLVELCSSTPAGHRMRGFNSSTAPTATPAG
jgi:hypothetical protein